MICQNKTIFIHIPKTGGTSVSSAYSQKYTITQFRFSTQTWSQGFATHYLRGWRNSPPHWMYVANMHATYDQYALQYPDWNYVAQVLKMPQPQDHLSKLGVLHLVPFHQVVVPLRLFLLQIS